MREVPDTPLRDAVILDRLAAPIAFDELSRTVESMMLSAPLERTPIAEYTSERALIANLGAHGLRVALECKNGAELAVPSSDGADSLDMLRRPDEFVDQEVPGVAEWALDFGDALLKDAYKCLGKDAEQKLVEYRAATTADEQVEIITWLDKRLYAMREPTRYQRNGEPEEMLLYHPIRLSPKVVGIYPNIEIPPTCLGFSIIATSFLYSAGAPTLHAGVMRTDNQEDIVESCLLSLETADDIAAMFGHDIDLTTTLRKGAYGTFEDLVDADSGYHAVALTRLLDGRWAQIDPNFRSTLVIDEKVYNDRTTTVYDELNELAPVAPLLELTASTQYNSAVKELRNTYSSSLEVSVDTVNRLREVLTDDDIESLPRRIYEVVIDMYKWTNKDSYSTSQTNKISQELEEVFLFTDQDDEVDYLSDRTPLGDQIYALITKYVLYEQDVVTFKQRCRDDKRFLERRISDTMAIVVAIKSIGVGLLVDGSRDNVPHMAYEVGRAAPRVAMTVLNDFAGLMSGGPLPPTFWHSTWPSLVPITESVEAASSPAQRQAIAHMLQFVKLKTLQYIKDYDTIENANDPTT